MSLSLRLDGILRALVHAWGTGAQLPPQGRLSLTSGVPVMTADVAAATTIYYVPYVGQAWPAYDGVRWRTRSSAQLSLTLDTTNHVSGKNYDLFAVVDAGVERLVSGPAWTSDTVRSAALAQLNGIETNSASMTAIKSGPTSLTVAINQATYLGTFRATAAGQTAMVMNPAGASGGSAATIGLWNMHNRRLMAGSSMDTGASYTYSSATVRQARASAGNQVNFICGLAEDTLLVGQTTSVQTAAAAGAVARVMVGLDSTSVAGTEILRVAFSPAAAQNVEISGSASFAAQIGWHFVATQQAGDGTNASTYNPRGLDALSVTVPA